MAPEVGAPGDPQADGPGMLAVDLGGTWMRVAVFASDGTMAYRSMVPTPLDDPAALSRAMTEALGKTSLRIGAAVVGVPGPISYQDGEALLLPNLPGWAPHVAASRLAAATGLRVFLANDADLAALGEHRFGAGQGVADMVYMTASTGVGGGVVVGGRLLRGHYSLAEAGHMIIDRATRATVQDLGSGTAMVRRFGIKGQVVTERARAGDADALAILRDVADALAVGVHNLVHCFMPERVVIGGGVSEAGDLVLGPIRAELDGCTLGSSAKGSDVLVARGGEDVGLLGAYAFWLDESSPA